jgi:hypothetical protein
MFFIFTSGDDNLGLVGDVEVPTMPAGQYLQAD